MHNSGVVYQGLWLEKLPSTIIRLPAAKNPPLLTSFNLQPIFPFRIPVKYPIKYPHATSDFEGRFASRNIANLRRPVG